MSEKRFVYEEEHFPVAMEQIRDTQNNETYDLRECCELLNELDDERMMYKTTIDKRIVELKEENEQLRTQLLICQQSKSDDGRIKVWQVPPIPKGMRITSFTTFNGENDE